MAIVVDVVGIAVEARVVAVPHRFAEVDKPLRRPEMLLSAISSAVLPARLKGVLDRINRIDRIGRIIKSC